MGERMVAEYVEQDGEQVLVHRPMTADELAARKAEEAAEAAALDAAATEAENEATVREQLAAALGATGVHLGKLTDADGPTAAELRAAVVFALRVERGLIRLLLRRLDTVDE